MRKIDAEILRRSKLRIQSHSNNAEPHAKIVISRPMMPLTQKTKLFLERQPVLHPTGTVTDCSIVMYHPKFQDEDGIIWFSYLQDGGIKIKRATAQERIEDYLLWEDYPVDVEADAYDLAFPAVVKRDLHGQEEYVTEDYPYVFWVKDGAAYCKSLTDRENSVVTYTLATENCTDISAIRAPAGTHGYDFGLIAFMLISGNLYYRQFIDREWYDAEMVSAGPTGITYTKVASFRTWDYRIGVQLIGSDGKLYELFSQFEGIGTRNQEHIDVADVNVTGYFPKVRYKEGREDENLSVASITAASAMYRAGVPSITEAYNISTTVVDPETQEESVNWGVRAVYVFDRQLVSAQVAAQYQAFTLVDSYGIVYYPNSAALSDDGYTVTLTFTDFNNAYETCQAKYTPGTVQTMAGDSLVAVSKSFTPQNLTPSEIPAPEVESIWNE